MKKRKVYILFLVLLFALSITGFSITASAYSIMHYLDYEDNISNYDTPENNLILDMFLNWETLDFKGIDKTDGPYQFAQGAAVSRTETNQMAFTLACTDKKYVNYDTYGDCYFTYQVTLLRQGSADSKYVESKTYAFIYDYKKDELGIYDLGEMKQYQSNKFAPIMTNHEANIRGGPSDFKFEYITSEERPVNGLANGTHFLRINFTLESPYQEYRVLFRANRSVERTKEVWDFWPFKKHEEKYIDNVEEYSVLSDKRSYYQILNNINEAGALEKEFADTEVYDYVQDVLVGEDREYNVEYLQDIEGTPFAKKVSAKITVRGWDDIETLNPVDVSNALEVKGVNTLISACSGFKKNGEGIFVADYYSGVYLEAKTVDGKVNQYILNPNNSYASFYSQLVKDGVISQNLYEYEFNEILRTFPELEGLKPEEVYGYFGYIVIPATFSLNQAYADLFNTQVKFDGVVNCFEFEEDLTLAAYNKLLNDYNYAWLSRIWNDVWGTLTQLNAKHVVLHADCTTSKAYGAMNGSEEVGDTGGLIGNEIGGVVEDIGNTLDNTASSINKLLFGGGGQVPWLLIFGLIILAAWLLPKIQTKNKSSKRRSK